MSAVLASACAACFSPQYGEQLTCSEESTCPPGQGCDEVSNTCTVACANHACEIELTARTVRFEQVQREPRGNVVLRLTSLPPADLAANTTDDQGLVTVDDLAPYTALEMLLSFPQKDPEVYDGILATRYLGGNISGPLAVEVPVVEYRWLAKVAYQCGIFASLQEAMYAPDSRNVNHYFFQRGTVLAEVLEEDGSPAPLTRMDIEILVDGWKNTHANPDDLDDYRSHVCFLEPDTATNTYVGTTADSSSSGRFVMFRVRNTLELPRGWAQVHVPGYPEGLVNLRSAGDIGVVRIQRGVESPPPPPARSFANDVYPLMTQLGCRACHTPGKPGYDLSQPRGGMQADFSGTADDVYKVMLAGSDGNCETTPSRVCKSTPPSSLFYSKPRLETGGETSDHMGIAFPQGSTVLTTFLQWIENGASP